MPLRKFVLHSFVFWMEMSALFYLIVTFVVGAMGNGVLFAHFDTMQGCLCMSIGLSACFMSVMMKLGALRLKMDKGKYFFLLALMAIEMIMGCVLTLYGFHQIMTEYPEVFRFSSEKTAQERCVDFGAVKINFDNGGGQCLDSVRVVKVGFPYGSAMNLYPSEDERYFTALCPGKINLHRGLLVVSGDNVGEEYRFVHYFTTNVVHLLSANETWTYVVDIDKFSGEISDWYVGQTLSTNQNEYVCLEKGRIGANVIGGNKRILHLKSNPWKPCKLLDRGVIVVGPGQHFNMSFRVSLFAGAGIDESNYRYVRPGETLACPLPMPTREGYAFEGWYDGDRRITEESKVERHETHTLKAKWRKL